MVKQFLFYLAVLLAIAGFILTVNGAIATPAMIDHALATGSGFRTFVSALLVISSFGLMTLSIGYGGYVIFRCALLAFCVAMMGLTLGFNSMSFSQGSPAGNPNAGLMVIGITIFAIAASMILAGRRSKQKLANG